MENNACGRIVADGGPRGKRGGICDAFAGPVVHGLVTVGIIILEEVMFLGGYFG